MPYKKAFGFFNEILQGLYSLFHKDFVTAIIPAYNEEETIQKVIDVVKKAKVDEIVVVDDGSKDKTYEKALKMKSANVKIIRHKINKGKGAAMRTGIEHSKGNIITFIDADLRSLNPKRINLMIDPILKNEADFVKSYFSHYKSKTSTSFFVYRPLLRQLFGKIDFIHPVSGQIAGRRNFFENIAFRNDYGVDISILIDAITHKLRIKEVCLGKLSHKKKTVEQVEDIADQIIRTILEKVNFIK